MYVFLVPYFMTQHLGVELVHVIPRGDAKVNEFFTGYGLNPFRERRAKWPSWWRKWTNLDEDEINALKAATRDQVNSELWRSERKYRFTESNFHLISHRQRNNKSFAKTLINPKPFTLRHTMVDVFSLEKYATQASKELYPWLIPFFSGNACFYFFSTKM